MGQNYSDSDVIPANLLQWEQDRGWDGLDNIMALDDGGFINANDYTISNAIPFNWVLDADHVIRFKLVGYGTISGQGAMDWVVQQLLAEM